MLHRTVARVSRFRLHGLHAANLPPALVGLARLQATMSDSQRMEVAARERRVRELRMRVSAWTPSDPFHLRSASVAILARTGQDADIISYSSQALVIGAYATMGLVAAGTLGIDTTPVLALVGSAGVALGFALRDFASNMLSGKTRCRVKVQGNHTAARRPLRCRVPSHYTEALQAR